jgi:hypothetical protein
MRNQPISRRGQRIKTAPGLRLMSLVTFLYSSDDVERTFKPFISDWHKEFFEALATQRTWKSHWINIRYRYQFVKMTGLSKAWKLIDTTVRTLTSAISK